MPIEILALDNRYRHLNYLVGCAESGEALAIDPFDVPRMLAAAQQRQWRITQILVTHEHWDHAGRARDLIQHTGATLSTHRAATAIIEHVDRSLEHGDLVTVGTSINLRVLYAPGHTMTHIMLAGEDTDRSVLLSGDTIFAGGVGNCRYGGHAPTLFESLQDSVTEMAGSTHLLPGHDYLDRNLEFTLSIEPDNSLARTWLESTKASKQPRLTTLADERGFNCFFRLAEASVIEGLSRAIDNRRPLETPLQRFLELRALRDAWK